jgi:hypothetical protein
VSYNEKYVKWETQTVEHGIWESYNEKHGKWETDTVQHGKWVSCTEKHGKWEMYSVEHGYEKVTMKNIENEKKITL